MTTAAVQTPTHRPHLYYFGPPAGYDNEFVRGGVDWWPHMDDRLLVLLDAFRAAHGRRVLLSPHPRAIGRRSGPGSRSDHNVDRHGVVLGVDTMPEGMTTPANAEACIALARRLGFTAIGVYPHWAPSPGLHLAARRDRQPGDPALWGAVRRPSQESPDGLVQTYVSVAVALAEWERPT